MVSGLSAFDPLIEPLTPFGFNLIELLHGSGYDYFYVKVLVLNNKINF